MHLTSTKNHPTSVYSYIKFNNILNFNGIDFLVKLKNLVKFEKQNADIGVNVISEDEDNGFFRSTIRLPSANVSITLICLCLTTKTLYITYE